MIPVKSSERETFKRILSTVFNVDQLKQQLAEVEKNLSGGLSDHADVTTRQYKSLLEEVIADKSRPIPAGTSQGPTVRTLRRKAVLKGPK